MKATAVITVACAAVMLGAGLAHSDATAGLIRRALERRRAARVPHDDVSAAGAAAGHEVSCGDVANVGFRTVAFGEGSHASIWYPATAAPRPFTYANHVRSVVAPDAPPAACGRVPLVVFSHGFRGCSLQSLFLTEELARRGYVVAAPDHADAHCAAPFTKPDRARPELRFRDPDEWSAATFADRGRDVRVLIDVLTRDDALGPIIDTEHIGVAGHSLGGYTAIGVAGGWSEWRDPRIKAALLLSPYVTPYDAPDRIAAVDVPVMYQGGTLDLGTTPAVRMPGGAYDRSRPPKYYVEIDGIGHFGWTNIVCRGTATPAACVMTNASAASIDRYAIAFFDRYLKGVVDDSAWRASRGVSEFRRQD